MNISSSNDFWVEFLISSLLSLFRFICLQWALRHYEAGDFEPRRNWGNFPNQCIWSLMMKFLKQKTVYFQEWWANSVLNGNQNTALFTLVRDKHPSIFFGPPQLVLIHSVCLHIPRVCLGLAAWADGISPRGHWSHLWKQVGGELKVMIFFMGMLLATHQPMQSISCWKVLFGYSKIVNSLKIFF